MREVDRWGTLAVGVGFLMWAVFNGHDFNAFVGGLAKNFVGLTTGIATIKPGSTPAYGG